MAANPLNLGVTFLGCGKLNASLLTGILASLSEHALHFTPPPHDPSRITYPPPIQPSTLTACVHSSASATALNEKFADSAIKVNILTDDNVAGVRAGAIIILGVEPSGYSSVLSAPGMRDALAGKILVSLVGGVGIAQLRDAIYGANSAAPADGDGDGEGKKPECHIIRVTPNTASSVRDSHTLIIKEDSHPYPRESIDPVYSLFLRVGSVKIWPAELSSAAATVAASSPAFFALALEGVVNGAVELGIERMESVEMAVAAMRGAAALVAGGEEMEEVRRKVATPGGSTERGLRILEEGGGEGKGGLVGRMAEAIRVTAGRVDGMGREGEGVEKGGKMIEDD